MKLLLFYDKSVFSFQPDSCISHGIKKQAPTIMPDIHMKPKIIAEAVRRPNDAILNFCAPS